MLSSLLTVYFFGMAIAIYKSYRVAIGYKRLKAELGVDVLSLRPDVKLYMFLSPFLWPYYFVTEKSPLERFSECFFKHYGDEGHTYFGTRGLKNFCNDLFLGKNRYKNFKTVVFHWPVTNPAWLESQELKSGEDWYARIICGHYHERYLMDAILTKADAPYSQIVSRFELDRCKRLTKQQFQHELRQINPERAEALLK